MQVTNASAHAAGPLAGRVALVTGSTSGIGLGIARAFAAAGAHLVLNGLGDRGKIDQIQAEITDGYGVRVEYSSADMSQALSIAEMIEAAFDTFGTLDVLVNNAGIQQWRRYKISQPRNGIQSLQLI
jgi:3-hydroxybutyrate dehydrogenase